MKDKLIPEIIQRKRDGFALSSSDIRQFIQGVTDGQVTDAQIAAFSMAAFFQDLDMDERTVLTTSMRDSGDVLHWDAFSLSGPILDKHSTGGVGDTVSFMLAPILAACGGIVPMIAGRGLAHTGGTIDKLEAIPGYNTQPSVAHFQKVASETGFAIVGQTANLAPADRRMYATRDVTATVEQYGLITASILSKKLAAGLQHLVMDIKVGNGAFMKDMETARELAQSLCTVGTNAGMPTQAFLTDMSEPLARAAGNALEVKEAIAYLSGDVHSNRLDAVTQALASSLLVESGLAADLSKANEQIQKALSSGKAAEIFAQSVAAMGGPVDLMERPESHLKEAPVIRPVYPDEIHHGRFVKEVDTRQLGLAVVALGGGRTAADQAIDHAVGCTHWLRSGEVCGAELPLAWIHARDEKGWLKAADRIRHAYQFDDQPLPGKSSMVIEHLKT